MYIDPKLYAPSLITIHASSALNTFFNFRLPAPAVVPIVLLLISFPIGKFLAFVLPIKKYHLRLPYISPRFVSTSLPPWIIRIIRPLTFRRAFEFSLNPGPWNIKEHVLVFIMANVAAGPPYALNAIVVSEMFYDIQFGYWFALVLVLATQLTGFGLAGLCRRFLVWPASMVWPQNLVACTLLNTLHAEDEDDGIGISPASASGTGKGITRYRFYLIVTVASFFFFLLPGKQCFPFFACSVESDGSANLLVDRLPFRSTFCLLVCLLGSAIQRTCQPAVRYTFGFRNECAHVRLVPNKLDWESSHG